MSNISDTASIASIIIGPATVLIIGTQLRFFIKQINGAAQQFAREQERARLQSALSFITDTMERRSAVSDSVPSPRDAEEVAVFLARLQHDPEAQKDLNRYLGYYETLAVGANMEIVDREVLNRAWGKSIIRVYDTYRNYIEQRRTQNGQPSLYRELEILCTWLMDQHPAAAVPPTARTGDANTATAPSRDAADSVAHV